MAVVGCFGDVIFQVSDSVLETIDKVEWSGSARYAVHERHLLNALTEFTGLDPDKLSFEMALSQDLGVDVMGEIVKLFTYERKGEAVPLVIGDKGYGKYRWNMISHRITMESYDKWGNLTLARVSVELQEYLRIG